jgi:hypothetical protein
LFFCFLLIYSMIYLFVHLCIFHQPV